MNSTEKKKLSKEEITERVYNNIVRTYASEKGKKFIAHLISEFMPVTKVIVDSNESNEMVCCLSKVVLNNCPEETNKSIILNSINSAIDSDFDMTYLVELVNLKYSLSSKGSLKKISPLAYVMLRKFVLLESKNGNKHINYFLSLSIAKHLVKNKKNAEDSKINNPEKNNQKNNYKKGF